MYPCIVGLARFHNGCSASKWGCTHYTGCWGRNGGVHVTPVVGVEKGVYTSLVVGVEMGVYTLHRLSGSKRGCTHYTGCRGVIPCILILSICVPPLSPSQTAASNIITCLWNLMESGIEELKLLQTVTLLLTANTVVQGDSLAKVKSAKAYL